MRIAREHIGLGYRALTGYEKASGIVIATYTPYLNILRNYGVLCKQTGRTQDAEEFYGKALAR